MAESKGKSKNSLYDYDDYRRFLIDVLGGENRRTGQRGALARHLGCQTAYLSQVLSGTANLSLEQALRVNQFLSHDTQSGDFFLLLVQKERAGTHELKNYFQEKIDKVLARHAEIRSRIARNKTVSEPDQSYYYSQWYIGAIHVALSLPNLQTVPELCRYFHLEEGVVREVLDFLTGTGLAAFERQKYSIGPSHLHLGKDSKFIKHLHTNWRLQALNSLERRRPGDLHYSVAYSLSRADAIRVRQKILELIERNMEIVRPSTEEALFCNTIDFFELKS